MAATKNESPCSLRPCSASENALIPVCDVNATPCTDCSYVCSTTDTTSARVSSVHSVTIVGHHKASTPSPVGIFIEPRILSRRNYRVGREIPSEPKVHVVSSIETDDACQFFQGLGCTSVLRSLQLRGCPTYQPRY
ncbi:hypothetical protein Mapa_013488 [Marchantia paleacea]|nr:hypothetical protein Mapa_013488 [Marchantia paleacea]